MIYKITDKSISGVGYNYTKLYDRQTNLLSSTVDNKYTENFATLNWIVALHYAYSVIKGRFVAGENIIMNGGRYARSNYLAHLTNIGLRDVVKQLEEQYS